MTANMPTTSQDNVSEKVKHAELLLEKDPYGIEAWNVLIRDTQAKKMDEGRIVFERLVTQFPTSGIFWKKYIEAEMKARNFEKVEKLFQRCLMKIMHIELWKCYLAYVRDTKANLPSYREKMAQAYDFALDKMGMDCMSFSIWMDYINFLKGVEAVGSYAENQRIAAVRKVYQRGVVCPMIGIEQLWKSYCEYEGTINPIIAKKMIEDRSRDYTNARRVSKELEQHNRELNRNAPATPPTATPEENRQVEQWKKYISWEKSNPLRTEDPAIIVKRVMFAYEQCLLCLGHHPDIWYEAASYLDNSAKQLIEKGDMNAGKVLLDEAAAYYERPINTLLPRNQFVYYAYADFEENRMKYDKVHSIYQKLIESSDMDPTLAYTQYMKFARRAEGIKSARGVFKKAREDQRCAWQVFVAAALMEYYCSKDKNIAFKIFELGLKKYNNEGDYVKQYLDYLSHQNEDNNTRVLFERILNSGSLPVEQSVDIWDKFLEFECETGDLASIVKVEKRRAGALDKMEEFQNKDTAMMVDRYRYLDLMPCSTVELISMGYTFRASSRVPGGAGGMKLSQSGPAGTIPGMGGGAESAELQLQLMEDDGTMAGSHGYMPDPHHMLPFQPKRSPPTDAHPVAGGVYPIPRTASELLLRMPPPVSFQGPFVIVDQLLDLIASCDLDKAKKERDQQQQQQQSKVVAAGLPNGVGTDKGPLKRKHDSEGGGVVAEDIDGDDMSTPSHDIYRARQQKRVV